MIRLKDVPLNEDALGEVIKDLKRAGYQGEEAQRIADESMAIAASFFKTLDAKIANVSTNEDDQMVIQALVLKSVSQTNEHIIRLIEAKLLMQLFRTMFR